MSGTDDGSGGSAPSADDSAGDSAPTGGQTMGVDGSGTRGDTETETDGPGPGDAACDYRFEAADPGLYAGTLLGQQVVADFDDDGLLDLAVTEISGVVGEGAVLVFFGQGGFTFDDPVRVPVALARGLAAGDFTSDGVLDLLVTGGASEGAVHLLAGDGAGGFAASVVANPGRIPSDLAVDDLDGDGDLDFAVAVLGSNDNPDTQRAMTFVNDGAGAFENRESLLLSEPRAVALGDVDGDGLCDLVVSSFSGDGSEVVLALGDGTGRMEITQTHPMLWAAEIALGDIDGDGDLDAVVASEYVPEFSGGGVHVLRGEAGGFSAPQPLPFPSDPHSILLHDFDADGNLDIVTRGDPPIPQIGYAKGNGDGTFGDPVALGSGLANSYASARIAVGDFDTDGRDELTVLSHQSIHRLVHEAGEFPRPVALDAPYFAYSTAIRDGELYVAGPQGELRHYTPDGSGGWASEDIAITERALAMAAFDNGIVSLHPDGFELQPGTQAVASVAYGSDNRGIASGDFDGDGADELLISKGRDGDGSVDVVALDGTVLGHAIVDGTPADVATGDLDGDGNLDAVVARAQGQEVSAFLGSPSGELGSPLPVLEADVSALDVGDVDGDGIPDVVAGGDQGVWVALGIGDGTFGPALELPSPPLVHDLRLLDLDGDGDLDVVSALQAGAGVAIHRGHDDGTFDAVLVFGVAAGSATGSSPTPGGVTALAVGQFDDDGLPDLALSDMGANKVTLLLGRCD